MSMRRFFSCHGRIMRFINHQKSGSPCWGPGAVESETVPVLLPAPTSPPPSLFFPLGAAAIPGPGPVPTPRAPSCPDGCPDPNPYKPVGNARLETDCIGLIVWLDACLEATSRIGIRSWRSRPAHKMVQLHEPVTSKNLQHSPSSVEHVGWNHLKSQNHSAVHVLTLYRPDHQLLR